MGWCVGACGPRLGMWELMPARCGTLSHAEERRWPRSCACWHGCGEKRGRAPGLHGSEHVGVLGHMLPPTPSLRYWTFWFPSPLPRESLTLPVIGSWGPKEEVVAVGGEGSSRALLAEPKLLVALGASLTELPLPAIQLIAEGQILA